MENLYKGDSESFSFLTDCYLDYGKETICRRALPDLRDGQKVVTRRVLYSAYKHKTNILKKSSSFVSDAMKLHPHGDQSIYGSFCLMTDENGSCNLPLFHGLGNFSKVYLSSNPAAMRYTKAILNDNGLDFFKDSEVMKMIPAEEGDGTEPTVLNAVYPVVLVNGTSGIAVAVANKIPSFNFGDVCDLTIKYLREGTLGVDDIIVPDFPTGGVLVRNDIELAKIMKTGRGKLKIRAKIEISGKTIYVKEVPFGMTVENICNKVQQAKDDGLREIVRVSNIVGGRNSNGMVAIDCKSKKCVDYVLMELFRKNILQNIYASNIIVTENEVPYIIGVHSVIERWCNWRKSVVIDKFNYRLQSIEKELNILDYFIRLVSNDEWKNTYVKTITRKSKQEATNYLYEIFPDINNEICDWIAGRSVSAFNRGGTYINRYNNLKAQQEEYQGYLKSPEFYIVNELEMLKAEKKGTYERKTEVTYKDYKFSKLTDSEEIEDTSFCYWTLKKDGFLVKGTQQYPECSEVLCEFEGQANDILIGFDNYGRLLRVKGSTIERTPYGNNGTYLPVMFNGNAVENYKILYMGILDGKTRTLVYRDGYVGYLDTSEFLNKKVVGVVQNGVCQAVFDKLLEVYEEGEVPQMLLLANQDYKGNITCGIADMGNIQAKSRLSRTKVLQGKVDAPYLRELNGMDMFSYVENYDYYIGRFMRLRSKINGDVSEIRDGKYLELCKDFTDEDIERLSEEI